MTKHLPLTVLFLFLLNSVYAQTKFGVSIDLNRTSFQTNDLATKAGIGFGAGLTALSGIHKSADLISEITYNSQSIFLSGVDKNTQEVKDVKFNITNFNLNFFYNQYLIIPNGYKPHIALQLGPSISILNSWERKKGSDSEHLYQLKFKNGLKIDFCSFDLLLLFL